MTTLSPALARGLRQGFKRFNPFMLGLFRLGLGGWVNRWPDVGGRILVLAHTGRRTGRRRLTPLNYGLVDGEVYITAGFGAVADWYRNIRQNPAVEVWLPDGWWQGEAEEVTDPVRRLPLLRQVLIGSGIVAPLAGVNPRRLSDPDLERASAGYRVLHIRREAARTGPGGPGDLAWVWPLSTALLATIALIQAVRRK
jgi:deazaflavin-dependent oxidoreductase (nitroreductase family)